MPYLNGHELSSSINSGFANRRRQIPKSRVSAWPWKMPSEKSKRNRLPPYRVQDRRRPAETRATRAPSPFLSGALSQVRRRAELQRSQSVTIPLSSSTKTSTSLDAHPASAVDEQNTRALQALYEQARVIFVNQPGIQKPTASDSEIMRRRATLQDAGRKVESESITPAVARKGPTQALSARCTEGSTSGIPEQKTAGDAPPRGPTTFNEGDRPVNKLTETANASILSNLRGIQWLDQLILDGTRPLAPDGLQQDARTVLKWLSIGDTEAIKTKHYDQFGRAIQSYIMEGQTSPAAVQSLDLALNDDIRGVFNRLLDREQAAKIFDEALRSFANVWIALIVGLNLIFIIGLVVSMPTLWTGIAKLSEFYSPFNGWNWIAEVVALSPALGAIAWRDRRLKRPWGAALLKLDFSRTKRLTGAWRGPVST